MKKHIVITIILLVATAYITVVYFKNLNPPGTRTSQIMHLIPNNAALVFEFNNDKGFYDIFKGNKLFTAIVGKQKIGELDTLRQQLLQNPLLSPYFAGQNIFISLHPSKAEGIDLLFTTSSINTLKPEVFDRLARNPNSGLLITPFRAGNQTGYNIYINSIKKRLYLVNKGNNIFWGSFSGDLVSKAAPGKKNDKQTFILLSEQQSNNSLANLYINYNELAPLFEKLFKNKNTDIFKQFKLLPALAALSLNYRSDALMFNGSTTVKDNEGLSYLGLFKDQRPVVNHLNDIFPSTTAYGTNFSISDPAKFGADLAARHNHTGLNNEGTQLFSKIAAETGVKIKTDFYNLLGNEFAVITTRYFEKLAVISVKNGSKLKPLMTTISTMTDENSGQLNYDKLPFFLLGDAFGVFPKPYFMIIDNYLILANTAAEVTSYYDMYINRKFLSKNEQYTQFEELLAGQSNVSFFFHFKNAQPILERDMYPEVYNSFKEANPGWKSFYAASYQFSAADKNFYTNFSMKLNADTAVQSSK